MPLQYFSLNRILTAKELTKKALKIRSSAAGKKMMSYIYFKDKKFTKAWKYFDGRLEDDNFIKFLPFLSFKIDTGGVLVVE